MFLETCPFLLGCPICWHITVNSILFCFFVFLPYLLLFLLFHLLSCLFGSTLFFLVSLARGLSILFIFSKNHLLVLLIFSVFLISVLFISSPIFIISFLLLTLGFACSSFPNSFRWSFKLFILDFYCFLILSCMSWL